MQTKTEASSTYATKGELGNKADTSALASKQDTLSQGDGIEISGNTVKVKIDGDTLSASASGLKVADGKFSPAE